MSTFGRFETERRRRKPAGRRTPLASALFAALLAAAAAAAAAAAEDVVHYATGADSEGRGRLAGTIVDFTGRELTLRIGTGREQAIPAERVLEIETSQAAEHAAGDRLAAAGEWAAALAQYQAALRTESRVWVRRQVLAGMISCQVNLGQPEAAAMSFLALLQSDPATQYFDRIPLAWQPAEPPPGFVRQAKAWLEADSPAAALIGASWLLASSDRPAAIRALERLRAVGDPRIAALAAAQHWRAQLATAGAEEVAGWEKAVVQIPAPLRGGPYFVLGQGLARHGRREDAALAMMRVAIEYPHDRALTAAALVEAADQLARLGRTGQALGLCREVLAGYADTQAAAVARALVDRLQESPPAEGTRS